MVDLSKEVRDALNPASSSLLTSVRQAGMTEGQRASMQQAVDYALRCGGTPPRTVQAREGATCTPEVVMYNAECTEQLTLCYMFRVEAFISAQNRLRMLLSNRPPSPDQHQERADWCWDVLSTVANALDATNVRPEFFNKWELDPRYGMPPESEAGPLLFPTVDTFIKGMFVNLRGQTGEIETAGILPPLLPSMGGDTESSPDSKRPLLPRMSHAVPWYVPRAPVYPSDHRIQAGPVVTDRIHGIYKDDTAKRDAAYFRTRPKEYLNYLFLHHKEGGLARGMFKHEKAESILDTKEWSPAWVMTGSTYMDYCAAWAQDVASTGLERYVAVGLNEWVRQLTPFYVNGMLDVPIDDLKQIIVSNMRETALQTSNMVLGTVVAVLGTIPVVGYILAAIVLVLQLVLNLILLFADMAAGWSCPLLPFKRAVASGECAVTTVGAGTGAGREHIDALVTRALPRLAEASGVAAVGGLYQPPPPQLPPPLPPAPLDNLINEEEPAAGPPWGKVAIAGGAIVGGALLLRFLRR